MDRQAESSGDTSSGGASAGSTGSRCESGNRREAILRGIARKLANRYHVPEEETRSIVWLAAADLDTFDESKGDYWRWASRWVYRLARRRLVDDGGPAHVPGNAFWRGDRATAVPAGMRVPATSSDAIEEPSELWMMRRAMLKCIRGLSERETTIVVATYGLFGTPQRTSIELGEALGLSPSHVRLLACKAMAKVRRRAARLQQAGRARVA